MQDFVIGMSSEHAQGIKVHWYWEYSGGQSSCTPCGQHVRRCYTVPVDFFARVDEKDRCKRCQQAFENHQYFRPKVGQIQQIPMPLGLKQFTMYKIVTKVYYKKNTYRRFYVKYIQFSSTLDYIYEDIETCIMPCESKNNGYQDNNIYSDEQIEYIKTMCKIIND